MLAKNEIIIWLPTKAPIRSMTAFTKRETRSLRLAGTSRSPSLVMVGKEITKYSERIKTVKAANVPERTDLPTPTTPPKAETMMVPSLVTSLNFF